LSNGDQPDPLIVTEEPDAAEAGDTEIDGPPEAGGRKASMGVAAPKANIAARRPRRATEMFHRDIEISSFRLSAARCPAL
jgi:hypothetical protein